MRCIALDFTALKAGFDKLDVNKLADVPTDLNNIKNVENLDIGKLKSVPKDLKKLSNVVSKENLKTTKFNKLNVKVTNFGNKILMRRL